MTIIDFILMVSFGSLISSLLSVKIWYVLRSTSTQSNNISTFGNMVFSCLMTVVLMAVIIYFLISEMDVPEMIYYTFLFCLGYAVTSFVLKRRM